MTPLYFNKQLKLLTKNDLRKRRLKQNLENTKEFFKTIGKIIVS